MRKPVMLGAYVDRGTPVHRMDARVKLVMLLLASVASFASPAPAGLVVATVGLVIVLAASRTSFREVLCGLRPAVVVLAFSLLANSVVIVGHPGISLAGFERGATAVLRIVLVVGFALAFSSTTMPPAIADALASLLSPLRRVGLPVGDLATMLSVALRFIPITMEEAERIRAAQRARGARLDEGGVLARLRGWGQVLVPLLVSLFRRADELASAMADRCYGGEQTSLAEPPAPRDVVVLLACVAWAAVAVLA